MQYDVITHQYPNFKGALTDVKSYLHPTQNYDSYYLSMPKSYSIYISVQGAQTIYTFSEVVLSDIVQNYERKSAKLMPEMQTKRNKYCFCFDTTWLQLLFVTELIQNYKHIKLQTFYKFVVHVRLR